MFKKGKTRARQELDRYFDDIYFGKNLSEPIYGWINAIRFALGINSRQLGRKIGISGQGVLELEKSEVHDTIQLKTLKKVAEALDCRLVYSLVPNQPLEQKFKHKAQEIARKRMARTSHSMSLEDQSIDNLREDIEVAMYIDEHLKERDLWEN